ncbi:MAG: ANTAR domain-containing response regulator [Thermodesulfobacteriota bacterium]
MKGIAIIDDDPTQRSVLKALVEDAGYRVVAEGADGSVALGICKDSRPDAVIMDVRMPGMDGITAAGVLARLCPVPVVLLTANDDPETVRRATEAGVMAYLIKPVRAEELSPAIELACGRHAEFETLKRENRDLKSAVEARKVIEKAKGLLMEKEGLTEAEAFARLRKTSMSRRKTMREVADVIVLALGPGTGTRGGRGRRV